MSLFLNLGHNLIPLKMNKVIHQISHLLKGLSNLLPLLTKKKENAILVLENILLKASIINKGVF